MGEFDVVDDFDEFKVTQLKDLPRPVEREFVKTKSVKDAPSEVSFKAIECKIQDYEIKKGGFMKPDTVVF